LVVDGKLAIREQPSVLFRELINSLLQHFLAVSDLTDVPHHNLLVFLKLLFVHSQGLPELVDERIALVDSAQVVRNLFSLCCYLDDILADLSDYCDV